jgi:hypothetical protein
MFIVLKIVLFLQILIFNLQRPITNKIRLKAGIFPSNIYSIYYIFLLLRSILCNPASQLVKEKASFPLQLLRRGCGPKKESCFLLNKI